MDYEAEVVSVDTGETVETPEVEETPEVIEEVIETTEEAPVVETKEEVLVELPDGRKLPPKEASEEYRNLYSDYTRKSQELATYKKGNINNNEKVEENPEPWEPQTWEEVKAKVTEEVRRDLEREQQQEQQKLQEAESLVSSQLEEIKKENPNLDENKLFSHAMKYNFQDLKIAHANMQELYSSVKKATETTAKNLQKRSAEPVSGNSQSGATYDGDVYDPSARNMSMVDYLRQIK